MARDIFKRLSAGRPPSVEKAQDRSPAQKLLDWLQRWDKPTVCVRDIRIYGPGSLRNQKKADRLGRSPGQKWLVDPRPDAPRA